MISQQNHVFIDPESCGSSVGYHLEIIEHTRRDSTTEYTLGGTIVLADCNHKIDWSFSPGDLDKIDSAIIMLKEFRAKFLAAEKMVNKLKTK